MCIKSLILLIALLMCSTVKVGADPAKLHNPSEGQTKCNSTSEQNERPMLKFRTPFVDLELQNERNLHITQELVSQHIFALHGNELYQVLISGDEKRLALIGVLVGSVKEREPSGVQVIYWHDYLIIVVALEEYLEVYQVFTPIIEEHATAVNESKTVQQFEFIQQLSLPGRLQKLFLIQLKPNEVVLVVAMNFTKLYGKLRTFEWANTYFNPVEELTVPPIHTLFLIGQDPKYLISGKVMKHHSKEILTVYQIGVGQKSMRPVQTLTVSSQSLQAVEFHGKNYIIACSNSQKKCNFFRMVEGQFQMYKQRPLNELSFEKFIAGKNFLVGARQKEILVYTNRHLNCYGSFVSNETEVNSIYTIVNLKNENFIILNYVRPFHTLMRLIEVQSENGKLLGSTALNSTDADDIDARHQHQHMFEKSIETLRSLLLHRKTAMDTFRQVSGILTPKPTKVTLKNAVVVRDGKIGVVNIINTALRSPMQLLYRIADIKIKLQRRRFARSLNTQANMMLFMPKDLNARKLVVKNLITSNNFLPNFNIDETDPDMPILNVNTFVTTRTLYTNDFVSPTTPVPRQMPTSTTPIRKITELKVEKINDTPWTQFYESLYLRNRSGNRIDRLILQAETKVMNLSVTKLGNAEVANLFNLKEPQIVSSNITISQFFVRDLKATRINGIDFAADVAFRGEDTFIETPVRMHQISVSGNLILPNQSGFSKNKPEALLQQHYTGKVIINGSLEVNSITRENTENSAIMIDGNIFSPEMLREKYLLRNEPQNFTMPIIFGNAKLTIPSLSTKFLNENPASEHFLVTDSIELENPLMLVFMQAHINGDLICLAYDSKVLEMYRNSVRHGQVVNITGTKVFTNSLTTDHLFTLELNDLKVNDLVPKSELSDSLTFNGMKSFEKIIVGNSANVAKELNCTYLNNLPLSDLLNYKYYLDSLKLDRKLTIENLYFQKLNGVPFDEVFKKFHIQDDQLVLHKDLIFQGNVEFAHSLFVDTINDVKWNEYVNSLVFFNENATINGTVRFLDELTITKALNSSEINGVDMDSVFGNILSKTKPQLITGSYSFEQLNATNLDVSVVNNIPTASFIDTREDSIIMLESDLIVSGITVVGNVSGILKHQLQIESLPDRLLSLPQRNWRNIVVLGSANWNTSEMVDNTQHDQLQYLYNNAVLRSGNQTITGNVKLHYPRIRNMITKTAFPKQVDLDFIATDCLYRRSENVDPQMVNGKKSFLKTIYAQHIEVDDNLQTRLLNKIDVLRLNASLYRVSSGQPIVGSLTFKTPPLIQNLKVNGQINGFDPSHIYQLGSGPMPSVKIRDIVVEEDLKIGKVNGMDLDYLLENRITKDGEALEVFDFLTFENLILNNEIHMRSINSIPMDNLVLKKSQHLQAITGTKTIKGNLMLAGPTHVLHLNGHDMIMSYEHSVFTNQNHEFDQLTVDEVEFEKGFVLTNDNLVGASNQVMNDESEQINAMNTELDNLLKVYKDSNAKSQPLQKFSYFNYDPHAEIVWQTPNETTSNEVVHQIRKVSPCERHLLNIQTATNANRIYLANITSHLLKDHRSGVSVKAKNYCSGKQRKVRSKITVATENLSKVFGMKKYIENVRIYTINERENFILLHAIDTTSNRNEVRILKVDNNNVNDWQSLTNGVGGNLEFYQHLNNTFLISSALVKNYPSINIYSLNLDDMKFNLTDTIHGDYDLVQVATIHANKFHLVLSCNHCHRVNIYEYHPMANQSYKIYQILQLEVPIMELYTFTIGNEPVDSYLLILAKDQYHLYQYYHVEGWRHLTQGHFSSLEIVVPIVESDSQGIKSFALLFCLGVKCNLVRALLT